MDQVWDYSEGTYDNYLFDDQCFNTYFDASAQLSTPQAVTTLDAFDFGVQSGIQETGLDNGFDSGYHSSPTSQVSQGQERSSKTDIRMDGMNPLLITSSPTDLQFVTPQLSNIVTLEPMPPPVSGQNNLQRATDSIHSADSATRSDPPVQNSHNDGRSFEGDSTVDAPPKVRKTRKRKAVSAEEKERKKAAFLARNREAAKKCRAKRKVQQEGIQEKSLRLSRYNAQCTADLEELRAMKNQLLLELLPYQQIPGVADEIRAIEAGIQKRPAVFFFHDDLGLLPISESALSMSQSTSRRGSSGSLVSQQTIRMTTNGHIVSRRGSNGSKISLHDSNSMQDFDSLADTRPRSDSEVSKFNPHKRYQPRPLDTSFVPRTSHESTSRSSSQNSARDSGIGNITPTTPQAHSLDPSDEGIIVASPRPLKRIDAALFDDTVDYFTYQEYPKQAYNAFLDPNEDLADQKVSREVPWTRE